VKTLFKPFTPTPSSLKPYILTVYGEAGVGVAWAEEARGAVGEAGMVGCVEVPALPSEALLRTNKSPASLARFSAFSTMPAPKRKSSESSKQEKSENWYKYELVDKSMVMYERDREQVLVPI